MADFVNGLQEWVAGLPDMIAYLGLVVIGTIPFVESYVGTVVGAVAGKPVFAAMAAATVGNIAAVILAGTLGGMISQRRKANAAPPSARGAKIIERTERFGVPVASLIAPTVFAISLTTFIMASFGLNKVTVIIWNCVAAIGWGVVTALLFMAGAAALS